MRKAAAKSEVRLVYGLTLVALILISRVSLAAWTTLETDHFLVHYAEGDRPYAVTVAHTAEMVHAALVERIGHTPREKTHIVVADDTDAANGYATPIYHNHIVVYPAFPTLVTTYLNGFHFETGDWLTLLLTHEYTHILHMDMQSQLGERINSVFGRVPLISSPLLIAPPMLIEGFAVYHESVDGGGRGSGTFYDMYLRTAVLADRLPEIDQVMGPYPFDRWQPGGHVYFYGYAFLAYLSETYGEELLADLNARMVERPNMFGGTLADLTGRSLRELWNDWRSTVNQRYMQQVKLLESKPLTPLETIPTVGHHALFPTPAPQSNRVAFVATGGVRPELRLVDLGTRRERPLAQVQGVLSETLAWHPTEEHIVVAVADAQPDGNVTTRLVAVETDSGSVHPIPDTDRSFSPTYDSTGRRLAFIRRSGPYTRLCVRDMVTGEEETLLDLSELALISVQWSPVDDRLALNLWSPAHGSAIALYDLASATLTPLIRGGTVQTPIWSRDGQRILFAADRTGVFNLYAYDVARHEMVRLTHTVTGLFYPAVTADGTLTAMVYGPDGYELALVQTQEALADEPPWIEAKASEASKTLCASCIEAESAYSPWPTLIPNFWLPSVTEVAGEPEVRVLTAAQEVLGRFGYTANVGVRIPSGTPVYQVEAEYHVLAGRHMNAFLTASFSRAPERSSLGSIPGWHDTRRTSLGVRFAAAHHGQLHTAEVVATRMEVGPSSAESVSHIAHRLGVAWEINSQGGRLGLRSDRAFGIRATMEIERPEAWTVQMDHRQVYRNPKDDGVSLAVRLGLAGSGASITLGDARSGFALRGYPGADFEGDAVIRAQLEGRLRLSLVERGYGEAPVFIKDVALHPFVEAGHAQKRGTEYKVTTLGLGAELGVRTYFGYGLTSADWRVGIAYGRGERRPHVYLRVASHF